MVRVLGLQLWGEIRIRYILSGKIGRKILPLKLFSYFLIINTGLVQVHYSHFWALWTPGGLWGALGWFGGV